MITGDDKMTEKDIFKTPWRCPVCGEMLTENERTLTCASRHSFDRAKQGYFNLFIQKKGTSHPGDDAAMVRARTAFLEGGYYQPFSDGVNEMCKKALAEMDVSSPMLVDAGCGEGYYTNRLHASLSSAFSSARTLGCDLSKEAVAHAARVAKAAQKTASCAYAVASLFSIPLADHSAHGMISLFAPIAEEEFARLLVPNGFLLVAVPAERHLLGLKKAIYDTPYENEVRRDQLKGFALTETLRIDYEVDVKGNDHIMALFGMTPYYWKTSMADAKKLSLLDTLHTELAFDLLLYKKI